jgi:phage-related protein
MSISFKWVPTYGSAVTVKPAVQVTKFGDGYELRTPTGINSTPRQGGVRISVCEA